MLSSESRGWSSESLLTTWTTSTPRAAYSRATSWIRSCQARAYGHPFEVKTTTVAALSAGSTATVFPVVSLSARAGATSPTARREGVSDMASVWCRRNQNGSSDCGCRSSADVMRVSARGLGEVRRDHAGQLADDLVEVEVDGCSRVG